MVKIENKNQYKVGDTVWWFDIYGNLRWGGSYSRSQTATSAKNPSLFLRIYEEGKIAISTGAKAEICWPTKEDCLKAEEKRAEEQTREYEESIKNVTDLVRFLYEHDVRSESRDNDAQAAAIKKGKGTSGHRPGSRIGLMTVNIKAGFVPAFGYIALFTDKRR